MGYNDVRALEQRAGRASGPCADQESKGGEEARHGTSDAPQFILTLFSITIDLESHASNDAPGSIPIWSPEGEHLKACIGMGNGVRSVGGLLTISSKKQNLGVG